MIELVGAVADCALVSFLNDMGCDCAVNSVAFQPATAARSALGCGSAKASVGGTGI